MIIISQKQLKEKISLLLAIRSIKKAFIASVFGNVIMPPPLVFELPRKLGEICIKTSFNESLSTYTIKHVSVMSENINKNIPTLNANMNIYNSITGKLLAVINEEGWLTNLRTACAGSIAEKIFRKSNYNTLGVVGAGVQASWQIKLILHNKNNYKKILIWNRTSQKVIILKNKLSKIYPKIIFETACFLKDLVLASDTIICVTSSQTPIIKDNMVTRGKTIISIGSDMPNKCEIDPLIYARADKIFVDSIESNRLLGNIKHAIDSSNIKLKNISGEIGSILNSKIHGRDNDKELILVSLVGIGLQDTYIGNLAYKTFLNNKTR